MAGVRRRSAGVEADQRPTTERRDPRPALDEHAPLLGNPLQQQQQQQEIHDAGSHGGRDVVLDFRLSHGADSAKFENQLSNFLLRAARRRQKNVVVVESLNKTVTAQRDQLVIALRAGIEISSPKDVESYFNQQYIRNEFMIGADKIVWDGETTADDEVEPDWTFCWSKRRIWTLRQVFLLHAPADHVTTETLFLPVYARIEDDESLPTTKWQCCTDAGSENCATKPDATFPAWITDDSFTGAGGTRIHLRQFLHESCEPFRHGRHLHATNVIYYLVVRNPDHVTKATTNGRTPSVVQIYIGKAGNGVLRRWLRDRWAHCLATRDVLEARRLYREFEQLARRCKSVKLVDCYLALGLLRRFEMALFVVRDCEDADELAAVETQLIHDHDATNMAHGLNCMQGKRRKTMP